jgi:hypothetical protein
VISEVNDAFLHLLDFVHRRLELVKADLLCSAYSGLAKAASPE